MSMPKKSDKLIDEISANEYINANIAHTNISNTINNTLLILLYFSRRRKRL